MKKLFLLSTVALVTMGQAVAPPSTVGPGIAASTLGQPNGPLKNTSILSDLTNIGAGSGAMTSQTTGASQNTAFGANALHSNTNYTYNTMFGYNAGYSVNAHAVTAFGAGAGGTISSGTDNSAFGPDAMNNDDASGFTTGVDNLAVGVHTLGHLTTGNFNVAIGNESMVGCGNWVGFPSCLLTGSGNVGVGNYTLQNITGAANENTAIGYSAGSTVTTGTQNLFVGSYTGTITTGNKNILIGRAVFVPSATSDGQLNIGNLIQGTGVTQGGAPTNGALVIHGTLGTTVSTVAALQTCGSTNEGARSGVTDATAPTFLGTLTGGGAVHTPVYCNGTAWVAG